MGRASVRPSSENGGISKHHRNTAPTVALVLEERFGMDGWMDGIDLLVRISPEIRSIGFIWNTQFWGERKNK